MFTAGLENIFLLWPSGNIFSHFSSCHTCLSFLVWSPLLSLVSDGGMSRAQPQVFSLFQLCSLGASPSPMTYGTTCILTTCKLICPAQTCSAHPPGCLRSTSNITGHKVDSYFPSRNCSSSGRPGSVKGRSILSAAQDKQPGANFSQFPSLHTNLSC